MQFVFKDQLSCDHSNLRPQVEHHIQLATYCLLLFYASCQIPPCHLTSPFVYDCSLPFSHLGIWLSTCGSITPVATQSANECTSTHLDFILTRIRIHARLTGWNNCKECKVRQRRRREDSESSCTAEKPTYQSYYERFSIIPTHLKLSSFWKIIS